MIAAIGFSEYLQRRTGNILRAMNGNKLPLLVGTDYHSFEYDGFVLKPRLEILNSSVIDIVYISSASGNHVHDCMLALKCGKHVFVEKPIALKVSDVKKIDETARYYGLKVFECLSYSYHPAWIFFEQEVQKFIKNSEVLIFSRFSIPKRTINDFRNFPHHGGAAADLGTYCIDALLKFGADSLSSWDLSIHDDSCNTGRVESKNARGDCYIGEWAIGKEYQNIIKVSDNFSSIEYNRVFSPPTDLTLQIYKFDDRGRVSVRNVKSSNASELCLYSGKSFFDSNQFIGLYNMQKIITRTSILEKLIIKI